MYIGGLIPWNSTELVEAVPIDLKSHTKACLYLFNATSMISSLLFSIFEIFELELDII